MKNFWRNAVVLFGGMMMSSLALAQGGEVSSAKAWIPIGAALAIGLAAFGAASAQGRATSAALEGIARNPNVVAINSALQVDLSGQVCADSIGPRIYSGIGGQMDFIRGAARSVGGSPAMA